MPLRSWSFRRIAALWVAGLVLQAGLLVGLGLFAQHLAERDFPRLHAEVAARNAREDVQDRASAASADAQRKEARERGEFTVRRNGDTAFAVVTTPSGRAAPPRIVATAFVPGRGERVVALLLFGAVPAALLLVTAAWAFARRGRDPQHA